MIKLLINFFFFFILISCNEIEKKELVDIVNTGKEKIQKKFVEKKEIIKKDNKKIFYYIGDTYYIEGVRYIPQENYNYSEIGLATYYGKELHNVKTINNDYNKVTELLGRHKTLPLPSIVKITNLENGLSITVKLIDRFDDNASIIQVSRKVAQLLGFYKNRLAKVKVEIMSDPSKQWKSVSKSINEPDFNNTVKAAPTDIVSISNIDEKDNKSTLSLSEKPIELYQEEIENNELYLKIYNFKNYEEIKSILTELELNINNTSESVGDSYNLILGPINNEEGNNLVSSFITKGYKKTEFIIK